MKINLKLSFKSYFWISITSIIVALLFLEVSIRTYDLFRGDGFFSSHRSKVVNLNQSSMPFRTFGFPLYEKVNDTRHILSRHGELYPLEKPPGTYRVVVFGGSSTENKHSYTATKTHYPLLLQSHLREELNTDNIEVINVGNSAYATPHSLILFELDVLSWAPDIIIVSHNINDLHAAYWPNFTFDYSNKYGTKYYMSDKYNLSADMLFQQSNAYWVIRDKVNRLRSTNVKPLTRKSYGNNLKSEVIKTFKRNLHTFVAVAKQNDIKVLLGNQPLQRSEEYFDNHMRHKKYNDIVVYPLHDEFVIHHNTFNKIIQEVAKETNVFFIDNDNVLASNEELFIDFVHYTPAGVQVLAQNYADYILTHNIITIN